MSRLARALGLAPDDLAPVARLGAVHAALGAATAAADALVQASFLARVGADALPWVLVLRAGLSPLAAAVYARAGRRATAPVLAALAVLGGAVVATLPLTMGLGAAGLIGAYAAHEIASSLLTMHWGVYLLDHLEGARARRAVAPVYAAARGGAALAGVALGLLVPALGARPVLVAAGALYLLLVPLAWLPRRHAEAVPLALDPSEPDEAPARGARRGWALLRRSPLLGALAAATVLLVLVRILLRYRQQAILDALSEGELVALLGWYAAGANVAGVALQLLITGRVLGRLGVGRTNLLYAGATLLTHVGLAFGGGQLGWALAARFADGELKHALKTPVSPLFYDAFWGADRVRARAFVLGAVSPAAQLAGALALGALVAHPA
ncbi:MAG TPA: hypothetical protein RMH80_08925, partial [Polyangiaceae bacterium LLY-WYZ-15_(1-7)]|nr:hypothetical protein [Polyangiaceae bacterium LLY-WYZ-15_(1-7)]